MPFSMMKRIENLQARSTRMTLQLVDRSIKYSHGMVEDVMAKVGYFTFPFDYVVMD